MIEGNNFILDTFGSMFKSGRLAHSFLIYGEKGLGKKEIAMYMAKALLCEKNTGIPCGKCRSCSNAASKAHPDLIFPEKSGKLETYSVETCRYVRTDSYVKPNDGERKVYVFSDCSDIQTAAQNAMLKIIEEPPDYAYFIFTAESKEVFLPTILSRVISLPATLCTENECARILEDRGFDSEQIKEACLSFGSNAGMCIEYIQNENLRNTVALTRKAAESIIKRDEYDFLVAAADPLLKDRGAALMFLRMLDNIIRDSVVCKINPEMNFAGCSKKAARELSERLSVSSAVRIHKFIASAADDISSNVNLSLIFSALCGEIMGY